MEAVLRRKKEESVKLETLEFGSIKLQLDTYKVYVDEEEVELTLKEFNILKFMIQSYPMVVSREMLMDKVWGYEYFGDTPIIYQNVTTLTCISVVGKVLHVNVREP